MKHYARNLNRRRGSVYILLIGMAMLASVIGISAALATRAQSRTLDASGDTVTARLYAQSAVDMGRLYISQNTTWRTLKTNGTWLSGVRFGNGTINLDVLNPNGALNRFDADPIILTGTGIR